MAESVARVKILAQIEGLEGFEKLKGAFRGLQSAIGPAETDLSKARKEILAFGKAGEQTERVIQGQVEALKALRSQAAVGGSLYRQLSNDITALGQSYELATTGAQKLTEAQLKTRAFSRSPSIARQQVEALRKDLGELDVLSDQYTELLSQIRNRENILNARTGRAGVIAGARAFDSGVFPDPFRNLQDLPNTTAALDQRVSELTNKLNNLDRGTEEYTTTALELSSVQRQLRENLIGVSEAYARLERDEQAAIRRAEKIAAIQRDAIKAPNVGGFRDPETGAIIARGSNDRSGYRFDQDFGPNYGPQEPSELFRQVMAAGMAPVNNQMLLMGKSGQDVAETMQLVKRASDGSISSLQAQRNAWEALRNSVATTDPAFKQATRSIQEIDKQLERTQLNGGLGGKVGYIAQGIGAAASAGIFGGPEGAIGGLGGGAIGALLGGPAGFAAGSFIGSSVGAYAGMGRQGLGGFADYAAQLEKQRIALQGVAGSAAEYQRALAAAQSVSDRFNVPIGETTKSMTQLSAAVIGAGGKVADAEVVYKNITAAIKATGGGAEEVQGALTAMAQIFSKGKVSAEELQGQLGERLPGAVTAFAKATGRTLPQLQKDLEQGTVGLNDVMKFVVSLGDQYVATADKISNSDEDAGQRFAKTLANLRAAIGKELVPIGAQLQEAFSSLLKEMTPTLISFAKGVAAAIKGIVDNAGAIGNLIKFAAQMGAIHLAIKGFIATRPMIIATFASIQLGGAQAAAAAALATPKVAALGAALKSLALLGIITVGVNVIVRGIDQVRQVRAEIESLRDYNPNEVFAGATRETVQGAVGQAQKDLKKFREQLENLEAGWWKTLIPGSTLFGAGAGDYQAQKKLLETRIARAQKTLDSLDPLKFPTEVDVQKEQLRKLQEELTKFQDPTGKEAKDAAKERTDNAAKEAERLAAEQQRLDEQVARAAIELDNARFRNRLELAKKEYQYLDEMNRRSNELWASQFTGRGSETARAVADLINSIQEGRSRIFSAEADVAAARQGLRSSRALESVTSQGLGGGSVTNQFSAIGSGGRLSSQAQALVAAAQKLGVSPLDLATIIGFETGGSYSPSQWGGSGNKYMGLIQFGPNERRAYGAYQGQSFEEQVTGPVVRYFQDRFKKVGMSTQGADLLTLYRTVLGGNPKASLTGRDGFGTSPMSGVARMGPHRSEALRRFFGGDVANIPSGMGGAGMPAQIRRDVAAEGQVAVSKEDVAQSEKLLEIEKKRVAEATKLDLQAFNQGVTRSILEQGLALERNLEDYKLKARLEAEGMRPELVQAEMDKARIYREQAEALAPLQEALEVVNDPAAQEKIKDAIEEINRLYGDQIFLVDALANAQTAQGAALAAYVGQLKLQLQEMTNIENVLIRVGQTIETEISTAMSSAISSVVTGSGSVKEALGNMFKSIGQSFVKMATDIIAKQLIMVILNRMLGFFGGGGGLGGGGATAGASSALSFGKSITGFAKGGVVNRPTFFKFANGGTMKNGVMGEAGPEAIVPLKRGFDGKLGIAQVRAPQGGDTRMRDMMGRSPAQQQAPTLNLKFETTKINGVEYVSKDQLEVAMAQTRRQAANDGAKRGMNMTLDKIQNSPSTRSRVGIR